MHRLNRLCTGWADWQLFAGSLLLRMLTIALCACTWLVWVQYTLFELGWQQSSTASNNISTAAAPLSVSLSTAEGSAARFDVNVANVGERHGRVSVLAMWRPIGHHAHLKQKLFGSSANSKAMYIPYGSIS